MVTMDMSMKMKPSISPAHERGFSLVEIVVVFIITGILMTLGVNFLKVYTVKTQRDKTLNNITISNAAFEEFFALNGRYPCPADPTLEPTDANFGVEQCRPAIEDDCLNNVPANISCTNTGSRDANGDGLADPVLIGGIPLRTLHEGINDTPFVEMEAQDAQNMLFSYAVSELMANPVNNISNPVSPFLGAIEVVDENLIPIVDPPGSAHFILVSHGDNKLGGYSWDGERHSPCLVGLEADADNDGVPDPGGVNAAGIAPEKENCDNNDAIFISGLRSMVEGANYYDDMVAFKSTGLETHWTRSLSSANADIYSTNLGNVGVGIENPEEKLHVANDMSVEGNTAASRFCNPSAQDCFDPNIIAGTGITPPAGRSPIGIEENNIIPDNNATRVFAAPPVGSCASGEYIYAVSNLGNIRCRRLY
jgi:type II secretory pathway pseudopilin PulG